MLAHVIDMLTGNGVYNVHNETLLFDERKMIFPEYSVCTTQLFTIFFQPKTRVHPFIYKSSETIYKPVPIPKLLHQ